MDSKSTDKILIVTDSPDYYSIRDLNKLRPGIWTEHDFTQQRLDASILKPYNKILTLVRREESLPQFDFEPIRQHIQQTGAKVVCHLLDYAKASNLDFHFRSAGNQRHKLEITQESPNITRGFKKGDQVYWYRCDTDIDEPPMGHYSYREIACESTDTRTVLAKSTMTGGAMWIEEKFDNGGGILAYDLFSPLELCGTKGDPWVLHRGVFNKYIPLMNYFFNAVKYGQYLNEKPNSQGFLNMLEDLVGQHSDLMTLQNDGIASSGHPLMSVRLGNPNGQQLLLTSTKHGMEWENAHGSLATLSSIAEHTNIDLDRFGLIVIPLLNPYGYENGCRQNANGVDLNRQLRDDWETFRGWTDEVIQPWTFDYKGDAKCDQPEAKLEHRLISDPNCICYLDAHSMASGTVLMAKGPEPEPVLKITKNIREQLSGRYLVRSLFAPEPTPLDLEYYPGVSLETGNSPWRTQVAHHPYFHFVYESIGQLPDVHATLMQTDFSAGLNIAILEGVAEHYSKASS